jgi:uridine phosphorylase
LQRRIPEEPGMISPVRRKRDPFVGTHALMVMTPYDLKILLHLTQAREISLSDMGLCRLYQAERAPGSPITLAGPCLGAPQAVIALEKLIALGAQKIWVLGWCGSIQPSLRIGDLLIPSAAVSEEGTSRHYPIGDREVAPDWQLAQALEERLAQRGSSFLRGAVWTTDAPYRETVAKITRYQGERIMAVEMEMSALLTVAIYRSVSLAGLLVVSDELFDSVWRPGFSDPGLKKASRMAGETLLDLVT